MAVIERENQLRGFGESTLDKGIFSILYFRYEMAETDRHNCVVSIFKLYSDLIVHNQRYPHKDYLREMIINAMHGS